MLGCLFHLNDGPASHIVQFMQEKPVPFKLSSENPEEWTLADCQKIANGAEQLRRWEERMRLEKKAAGHAGEPYKNNGPATGGQAMAQE
jgi:hypothetical protein